MNRREFIKFTGVSAAYLLGSNLIASCNNSSSASKNRLYIPSDSSQLLGYYKPSGRFEIYSEKASMEIFKGKQTDMLVYRVKHANKTYYNPIIIIRKGSTFEVDFINRIGEESIIHWHGFRAHWRADGHPAYSVANGNMYSYPSINIIDRSGTYFYHPHPHGRTGFQVYHGLAGMIIIEDDDEDRLKTSLDLQYGKTDVPLIIQDKTFNSKGSLIYNPMGMNGSMGMWGNTILVNLTPNPFMEVERRIYRFRLLNGSNARPYRLVLKRGSQKVKFWVIGVEGGLLDKPYETTEILIAPGERIDILIDFRLANVNDVLKLYSLEHGLAGMMQNMRMGSSIEETFEVLEFRVKKNTNYDKAIPKTLSSISKINTTNVVTRNINLGMSMGKFNIDGMLWDKNDALKDYGYNFTKGDIVEITFINNTGMFHPMHLHGFQFQVIKRVNSPSVIKNLAIDSSGIMVTDLGWKDTVIVGPHESVTIAVDMSHNFNDEQVYLLHCHILEHHDQGMMINYRVSA